MKLILEKHGGLAALRFRPKTIDTAMLPPDKAAELARLVIAVKRSTSAEERELGRTRDTMSYMITIEDGIEMMALRQSDHNLSPAFAALLDYLDAHAAE